MLIGTFMMRLRICSHAGFFAPPPAVLDELREESEGIGFPEFDTYAIGWTVEGDQPGFVVAYHTTGDADLAVDQIAARWDGIDFRGRDMSAFVEVTDIEAAGHRYQVGSVVCFCLAGAAAAVALTLGLMPEKRDRARPARLRLTAKTFRLSLELP